MKRVLYLLASNSVLVNFVKFCNMFVNIFFNLDFGAFSDTDQDGDEDDDNGLQDSRARFQDSRHPSGKKQSSGEDIYNDLQHNPLFKHALQDELEQSPVPKIKKDGSLRKAYNMQGKRLGRTEEQKTARKVLTLNDMDLILEEFKKGCCDKNCLWINFSASLVGKYWKRYSSKNEKGRSDLLRRLAESARTVEGERVRWEWKIYGKVVCEKTVRSVFGCSQQKLNNAKQEFNKKTHVHGN